MGFVQQMYYNGCLFESPYELKYALSIEEDYAYLLHPKRIYDSFYRGNGKVVEINERTANYTPDFLIRSYQENTACVIEIKGHSFNDLQQYEKRNAIMNRYLGTLENPPDFRWVFWDDKMLSKDKAEKFLFLEANQAYEKEFYNYLRNLYNHNDRIPFSFPHEASTSDYLSFVNYGVNPFGA